MLVEASNAQSHLNKRSSGVHFNVQGVLERRMTTHEPRLVYFTPVLRQ